MIDHHPRAAQRGVRLFASTLVLLALIGAWIGHTLEYLRVWGGAGLRGELVSSGHIYMAPLAGVLIVLATLTGLWWWRAWMGLGMRIEAARLTLRRAFRGDRSITPPQPAVGANAPAVRLLALWVILGALQIGAYLTQENLEALFSGGHAPLLRAITGIHAMAPLIQLDVALLLAAGMVLGIGRVRRRYRRVTTIERLLRVVFGVIGRPPAGSPMRGWRVAIRPRFARHLWKRPPPLAPALRR